MVNSLHALPSQPSHMSSAFGSQSTGACCRAFDPLPSKASWGNASRQRKKSCRGGACGSRQRPQLWQTLHPHPRRRLARWVINPGLPSAPSSFLLMTDSKPSPVRLYGCPHLPREIVGFRVREIPYPVCALDCIDRLLPHLGVVQQRIHRDKHDKIPRHARMAGLENEST